MCIPSALQDLLIEIAIGPNLSLMVRNPPLLSVKITSFISLLAKT